MGVGVADIERAIRWYREGARSGLLILTSLSANCRARGTGQWRPGQMGIGSPRLLSGVVHE